MLERRFDISYLQEARPRRALARILTGSHSDTGTLGSNRATPYKDQERTKKERVIELGSVSERAQTQRYLYRHDEIKRFSPCDEWHLMVEHDFVAVFGEWLAVWCVPTSSPRDPPTSRLPDRAWPPRDRLQPAWHGVIGRTSSSSHHTDQRLRGSATPGVHCWIRCSAMGTTCFTMFHVAPLLRPCETRHATTCQQLSFRREQPE